MLYIEIVSDFNKLKIMGGVPKQRHTKSRRNNRRMHLFTKSPLLASCPKCAKPVLPHTVCQNCGCYKGREYINVLEKLNRKDKKAKEKELAVKDLEGKMAGKDKPLNWEGLSKK